VIAVGFGIGIVWVGHAWLSSRGELSQTVALATGRIGPAAAALPADDGSWTDADIRSCRDKANAAAEVASKRKLAAVSAGRVGLGGPDADIVRRANYLLCGATQKRLHLCQSYWHDWFMAALKEHAADFKKVSNSAYWTKVSMAEQARSKGVGDRQEWQAISDDLDQTTREVGKMHSEITAAFRGLIADGIIDPGDFGVFLGLGIPPDIAAMIGDVSPTKHLCG
jgi:hypothetical protein